MSLRYKALIAAVLLVALVTGVLVWRAGNSYEQAERERIREQLGQDARNLNDVLEARANAAGKAVRSAAQTSELVVLFATKEIKLEDNLLPMTRDWTQAAGADIGLAAIDSTTAVERAANILHKGDELSIVALHVQEGLKLDRKLLLADPELNRRLMKVFVDADKASAERDDKDPAAPAGPVSLVLGIDKRVYLCVIVPLYASLGGLEVIGAGAALIELSSGWLSRDFQVSGGSGKSRVFKVVYVDDTPAASTWPDMEEAGRIFDQPDAKSAKVFAFDLPSTGERYLGLGNAFNLAPPDMDARPGFIAFKSLDSELEPLGQLRREISLLGLSLGVLACLLAYLTAYSVISRIRRLQAATVNVREGKFDTRVEVRGRDELSSLSKAFNDMTTGLKALGLYTHETLAKSVLDNPGMMGQASARHEGSIFFSDVKGFTSIAEKMGADELTAQLNEYFAALGRVLRDSRGYVDKFIGDGIMAFWGKPFVKEADYATRACLSALACARVCVDLRAQWKAEGKPLFFQRIGIATGEVVVGNIGTETKKNFTVIGDAVNLASRLEGANKVYGTEILVDARTAELAAKDILFREVDQIRVVGRQEPVRIFEPLAPLGQDTGPVRLSIALYERALEAYRERNFAEALVRLGDLEDGASRWLSGRCKAMVEQPPKGDWQPVTEATSK